MSQVALILLKDLRRLGWPLLLLWLLVLGGAWLDLRNPWSFEDNPPLLDLKFALTVLASLTSIVVVGLLIHQDPLLGTSAYWMTRPVRPHALLVAKAAFVFLYVVLFPVLVDLGVLIYFGLEPSRWREALFTGLAGQGLVLVVVAALAAVTPSIPVFLIACIAAAVAMLLMAFSTELWGTSTSSAPWGAALSVLTILGMSCVVVWRQYRRCDARISTAILAAGLLLGPWAMRLPWYRIEPSPSGERLSVTLSPTQPDGSYRANGIPPTVAVRWGLFNAPENQFYALQHLWGKIRLDDAQQIFASSFTPDYDRRSFLYRAVALNAALPGYSWFGQSLESQPDTNLKLHVDADAPSVVLRTVSFEGLAQLQAYTYKLAGALPITPGTRLKRGSLNLELVNARITPTDVVVGLRYSRIASDWFRDDLTEFLLVRKDRHQVARPRRQTERDSWMLLRNSNRSIVKPGGVISFRGFTSYYPWPFEAGTDRLEALEMQVWEAVPTEPCFGVIDLPFRTVRERW